MSDNNNNNNKIRVNANQSILLQRQKEIDRIVKEHNFIELNNNFVGRKENMKYYQDSRYKYIWEVNLTKLETYPEFTRPNFEDYQELMKLNKIGLKMTWINQQSQIYNETY